MDYEKAYKEVLSRAKTKYDSMMKQGVVGMAENIAELFPELKESEDERIRKAIFQALSKKDARDVLLANGLQVSDALAWLEKQDKKNECTKHLDMVANLKEYLTNTPKEQIQKDWDELKHWNNIGPTVEEFLYGKQKPTDKLEPKFEIGDLITNGILVGKIDEIHGLGYHAYFGDHYADVPDAENWHKWTIQDAKDGDVLLFEGYYNSIVLFQGIGINGKGRINYHCKCNLGDYSFGVQGDVAYLGTIEKDAEHYHPATQEQRDLLFQKMKEAGYEWDAEKKELKKIEQNPAWSEEDKYNLSDIEAIIHTVRGDGRNADKLINWLKSLKERCTWKPSNEQIDTLEQWLKDNRYRGDARYCYPIFDSLYQGLKKLKG